MIYTILTYLVWTLFAIAYFAGQFYWVFKDADLPDRERRIPEDKSHVKGKEYISFKRKITEEEKKRSWR